MSLVGLDMVGRGRDVNNALSKLPRKKIDVSNANNVQRNLLDRK